MNGYATTSEPRTAAKRRRVIGSFGSYADAKRILDHSPTADFAQHAAIAGALGGLAVRGAAARRGRADGGWGV